MSSPLWAPRRLVVLLVLLTVLSAACALDPLELPPEVGSPSPTASPTTPAGAPEGTVTVAYPDVPATWTGLDGRDVAATDLASLWALPWFRYDQHGQLQPALVEDVRFPPTGEGWTVELTLGEGQWSDGTPVTAADAAATLGALQSGPWAAELRPLLGAQAVDEHTLRLAFDRPYGRWADLLSRVPGVLPAQVVGERGLDAFASSLPVSGGSFTLESFEPGLKAVFVAHPAGPLGPPAVARVEVLFVPSYETALGLLQEGEVDLVAGHLALNPVARAGRVADVESVAPVGGTTVALRWREDREWGSPDRAEDRRAVAAAVDIRDLVDGLLGASGELATSPVPGVAGPWNPPLDAVVDLSGLPTPVLLVPTHEAASATARAIQRDVRSSGGEMDLVAAESPTFLDPPDPHDVVLQIRRDPPRPSLVALDGEPVDVLAAADATAPMPLGLLGAELAAGFGALREDAMLLPLYRVGVAHAWSSRLSGIEPSAWPGLAFWGASEWRVGAAES